MEPISIHYHMTEAEFMTAYNAHWSAHHQSTLSNVITGMVGVVVGLALLSLTFWLAVIAVVAGGLLLLITWLRSFLCRRAFRDAKKYNVNISVAISDAAVHVESAEGKSDLKWDFFTWYLDTPAHVLLYMTKRNFSIIPKSAFQDETQVQAFVELVKSKLKKFR